MQNNIKVLRDAFLTRRNIPISPFDFLHPTIYYSEHTVRLQRRHDPSRTTIKMEFPRAYFSRRDRPRAPSRSRWNTVRRIISPPMQRSGRLTTAASARAIDEKGNSLAERERERESSKENRDEAVYACARSPLFEMKEAIIEDSIRSGECRTYFPK